MASVLIFSTDGLDFLYYAVDFRGVSTLTGDSDLGSANRIRQLPYLIYPYLWDKSNEVG